MKKEITFNENTLRLLYLTYKEYIIPSVIIFFSFVLFLFVIIPQIQDYIGMQKQVNDTKTRIVSLKKNIQTLSSLDTQSVDSDYQTISQALPPQKDFVGILEAISKASANASVSVGDFSFSVGDLSTKSAQLAGQPSLNLTLSVSGSEIRVKDFIDQLSQASPIAAVSNVQIGHNSSSVDVAFYYKVIPQSLQVQYDVPLPMLSATDKKLVDSLRSWQENISSSSAQPSFVSF